MTPNPSSTSGVDTPTAALQRLAARAHRVLRQGRTGDRDELLALLDEIARSRRLLARVTSDELADWFDRLEAQVSGLLDRIDRPGPRHHQGAKTPSACGVGMA